MEVFKKYHSLLLLCSWRWIHEEEGENMCTFHGRMPLLLCTALLSKHRSWLLWIEGHPTGREIPTCVKACKPTFSLQIQIHTAIWQKEKNKLSEQSMNVSSIYPLMLYLRCNWGSIGHPKKDQSRWWYPHNDVLGWWSIFQIKDRTNSMVQIIIWFIYLPTDALANNWCRNHRACISCGSNESSCCMSTTQNFIRL